MPPACRPYPSLLDTENCPIHPSGQEATHITWKQTLTLMTAPGKNCQEARSSVFGVSFKKKSLKLPNYWWYTANTFFALLKKKPDRDLGCIRRNKMDLVTPSMSLSTAQWLVLLHLEQMKKKHDRSEPQSDVRQWECYQEEPWGSQERSPDNQISHL